MADGTDVTNEGNASGKGKEWAIECRDVAGRRRQMVVAVANRTVSVTTPPGEAGFLTWTAAEELRRAIAKAVAQVLRDETT